MATAKLLYGQQHQFTWSYRFDVVGASAFTNLNDLWGADLFAEKIKPECALDGYLLGVGLDSILSMLALFPDKKPPQGIISVDIDPSVVTAAKIMVHCFRTYPTQEEFLKACTPERFDTFFSHVYAHEENEILQEYMCAFEKRTQNTWKYSVASPQKSRPWLKEFYPWLHRLAQEEHIAVLHADLFDKKLLECVKTLPSWSTSSNLIYMANATDHIYRHVAKVCPKELFVEKLNSQIINNLETIQSLPPACNHYVDTTQATLYKLRLKKSVPYFSLVDF